VLLPSGAAVDQETVTVVGNFSWYDFEFHSVHCYWNDRKRKSAKSSLPEQLKEQGRKPRKMNNGKRLIKVLRPRS